MPLSKQKFAVIYFNHLPKGMAKSLQGVTMKTMATGPILEPTEGSPHINHVNTQTFTSLTLFLLSYRY